MNSFEGLIIYSERRLLFDSSVSTADDEEKLAMIVSHELAHQWLGNLVTIDSWNDLWLQEGIAQYFTLFGPALVSKCAMIRI